MPTGNPHRNTDLYRLHRSSTFPRRQRPPCPVNIHQTTNLSHFTQRALPFLRQRPAEHHLLLALLESLAHDEESQSPILITVENDGAVVAAALQTTTRPLLLSRTTKPAYVEAIAHHIKSRWPSRAVPLRRSLSKFGGPKAEAALFAQALRRWTRLRYEPTLAMRIHQLCEAPKRLSCEGDSSRSYPAPEGKLRPAETGDRDRIVDWCRAFEQETFGQVRTDPGLWTDRSLLQGQLYLWEHVDGPVCLVAGSGSPLDGGRIGPVYTPPQHRRRGYATAATLALSQHLLDSGCTACYLFTELNNSTSNHIYQSIGYNLVCDWDEYELRHSFLEAARN